VPTRDVGSCSTAAIERQAAAPHAAYISYSELINIENDGHRYERASANITYRDDGLASIDDDRWVDPFVSDLLEPGPPVLGPYGDRRQDWLAALSASTRFRSSPTCAPNPSRVCRDMPAMTSLTAGWYGASRRCPTLRTDHPALKEIWIDRRFARNRAPDRVRTSQRSTRSRGISSIR
jgi:hypothetical protein